MGVNFGGFRELEFEVDAVSVEEVSLILLYETKVEWSVGKDALRGDELKFNL